ncbi:MAG: aminotransferase class IV [Kiloniellaceae bacterium]
MAEAIPADNPFAAGAAFVDGRYMPVGEARIPLLDWGFLKSDVTYDVVGVWRGRFFRLDDHLDRFFRSMERLRLTCPQGRADVAAVLHECLRLSRIRDAYVEMITTRGPAPPGSRDPRDCDNRFYAFAIPYLWIVPPDRQSAGIKLVVSSVQRIPPESIDPRTKNFHWGDLTRGLFEAYERGGESVVLVDREGNVTEGPGFNLFALIDGRLITPGAGVLEGITRKTVVELARSLQIPVALQALPAARLGRAEEIFICSTAGGVMPVSHLDGQAVGPGAPGPLTLRIKGLYWAAHADPEYTTPVAYDAPAAPGAAAPRPEAR